MKVISAQGARIEVEASTSGRKARWLGILRCQHRWTCPCCAARIIAQRARQVADAAREGAARELARPESDRAAWQMVTLTLRHSATDDLRVLLPAMIQAWRLARKRGTIARLYRRTVRASIRAIEVTVGQHGYHPHIHLLLLARPWSDDERTAFARAWSECVERTLGAAHVPDAAHGVYWSRGSSASYIAKLGLEMTRSGPASSSPFAIGAAAADDYALALRLRDETDAARARERARAAQAKWLEYETSTRGVRAIELDRRANELARAGARECEQPEPSVVFSLSVDSDLLLALREVERRVDLSAFWVAMRVVEPAETSAEAEALLDAWIRSSLRYARRHGAARLGDAA